MTSRTAEVALADIAGAQWGLVTTHQAQTAGVSRTHLNRLTVAGVLIRLTHGVYALRTAAGDDLLELRCAWLTLDPTRFAADRLTDPTAVVSHASAAHLHGHGDLVADRHDFTLATRKQTRRLELRLHRGAPPAADVTVHRGLPVTTPGRTVLDLLDSHHDGEHVAAVLADAVRAHQVDLDEFAPRLAPFASRFGLPHRDGDAVLAHLLDLGDVTHEVEATALATTARRSNTSTAEYVSQLVSSLATQRVLDTFAAIAHDQVGLAGLVQAQLRPDQTAHLLQAITAGRVDHLDGVRAAIQAATAVPLQHVLTGAPSLLAQITEIARAAQAAQAPSVQAALDQVPSPQMQAQLEAVRQAMQR
jgi:hypothetical protein